MSQTSGFPLSRAGHARALLSLGLPLVGGHVAQFAVGATDTLMLGWYGVPELAAGVLGSTYFFVFFILGAGFAWAVMPMVAAESGSGEDPTQIRRVTRMGLWLSTLYAAIAMPVMIWSEPLLRALGQDPDTAVMAAHYLGIAGWALFPALATMVLRSYLAALERTQVVLWATVAGAAVNALGNWVLIFGRFGLPEMGVRGAALSSVLVQVVMFGVLIVYALRVFPQHTLLARIWRPDWQAFGAVFRLGWPIGLTNVAEVGMFSASAVMVGWLGAVPLAAHGIALQVATAGFMVHMGLSNAATIRAGNALGRKDVFGLRRGAGVAIVMSLAFACATIVVLVAMPEALVELFLAPDEPARAQIVALGVVLIFLAAAFQVVDGAQVVVVGLLRGVQDTRVPMVIAGVSYLGIGLPSGYVAGFVLGWGAPGVWVGLIVGLACAALFLSRRFWGRVLASLVRQVESGARLPQGALGQAPLPASGPETPRTIL
ncbi:MAG: MATE family efflux transporter [Pseudomonadota bacterium]